MRVDIKYSDNQNKKLKAVFYDNKNHKFKTVHILAIGKRIILFIEMMKEKKDISKNIIKMKIGDITKVQVVYEDIFFYGVKKQLKKV